MRVPPPSRGGAAAPDCLAIDAAAAGAGGASPCLKDSSNDAELWMLWLARLDDGRLFLSELPPRPAPASRPSSLHARLAPIPAPSHAGAFEALSLLAADRFSLSRDMLVADDGRRARACGEGKKNKNDNAVLRAWSFYRW